MSNSNARGWLRFAAEDRTLGELRFGYEIRLDGRAVTHRLARQLPDHAADLLEIAAGIHAIDRLVPRPRSRTLGDGTSWGRTLRAEIPVRRPRLWAAARDRLTELLAWLTDDHRDIEFSQCSPGARPLDEPQGFLFGTEPRGFVPVLFSGGLDSAAGLAAHLTHAGAVAVGVDTNNWMQHVQAKVLERVGSLGGHDVVPLRYRVNVPPRTVETSQRSRGLLYLAAGIASAWGVGQNCLTVFENGIGAINLPYLRSQYGSQATRSMHPRTLRLAEALAAMVGQQPFRIDAPALRLTKAEVIRALPGSADQVLEATVSCDTGFAARVPDHAPCGACSSCLLRRQALCAAGRPSLDTVKVYPRASHRGTHVLAAMSWQVERLRACLARPDPYDGLVSEFPELLDTAPLSPAELVRLYRAYVREWGDVVDQLSVGWETKPEGWGADGD